MKLLAIILTYYPEKDILTKDYFSFADEVDKVIAWENTSVKDATKYRFISEEKVEYMSNGCNSISKALNTAWHYAKENGYDALLTMDQDSCFENFPGYKEWAEKSIAEEPCICSPWYFGEMNNPMVFNQNHVITSGMIIPTSILDDINGYNEDFDIDAIDIDLCLRAKSKGYKILQNNQFRLNQHFGEGYEKKIFDKTFSGSEYSAKRLRGIFRNYIITYRRNNHPEYLKKNIHYMLVNTTKNVVFCEKEKFQKLFAIIKGCYQGLTFKV